VGTLRILLVDDDHLVRQMMADTLNDEGFEVIEASSGDEGAKLLVDPDGIDVIFTDVRMPGLLDGIDLALHARKLHPQIAVIVASGFAPFLVERLDKLDPPSIFFRKPYSPGDIIRTIRRMTRE
jgi:YesN/AraC family two-component response regulator